MKPKYYLPAKDIIRREIYQETLARLKGARHLKHEDCVTLAGGIADMAASKAYAAIDEVKALRTAAAVRQRQLETAAKHTKALAKTMERLHG